MLLSAPLSIGEADFKAISSMVYDHCGINLHEGKRELVQARIAKRLRALGLSDVRSYMARLQSDESGAEFAELVDAISTNLTSFFRESSHFDFLVSTLLPRIIAAKKGGGPRRIRVWSAGCSSGEEPYTLAMVLREHVPAGEWDIRILATDISRPVLATARKGVYDKQRVSGIPPALRNKYMLPRTVDGVQVYESAPSLKELIRFNHLNLMEPWPFDGPFDFIFCRNVMIYFDKPTQQRLVQRYWDVLSPGGMLFTGHSESLTGIQHRFSYVQPTIYGKL